MLKSIMVANSNMWLQRSEILVFKKAEPCTEQKDEKDVYILSSIFPNEDVMYKVDEIMRQKSEEENKTDKTH